MQGRAQHRCLPRAHPHCWACPGFVWGLTQLTAAGASPTCSHSGEPPSPSLLVPGAAGAHLSCWDKAAQGFSELLPPGVRAVPKASEWRAPLAHTGTPPFIHN